MDPVLGIGLIMLVGFLGGRIAVRLGLPSLTGYIIFGLLLGRSRLRLSNQLKVP